MKIKINSSKPVQFGNLKRGALFVSDSSRVWIKNFSDDAYNATQLGGEFRRNFDTDKEVEIVSEIMITV
jgi:hypothetical protein